MSPVYGTPLHCACLSGQVPLVELLLQSKANFTIPNFQGKTPIELNINKEVRRLLFKYIGEPDDTPNPFSSEVWAAGMFSDSKYWTIVNPIEKSICFYRTKDDYLAKKQPKKKLNLDFITEVRRSKQPGASSKKDRWYFQISLSKGKPIILYTRS
jgi:ankyrin repeat protein